MTELKGRGGQKQHAFEFSSQSTTGYEELGILRGFWIHKEGGQPRAWILKMVSLVENQEGRLKLGSPQGQFPDPGHGLCKISADALQTRVEIRRFPQRQFTENIDEGIELAPFQLPVQNVAEEARHGVV